MSKDLLTDRLVTTRRFAPADDAAPMASEQSESAETGGAHRSSPDHLRTLEHHAVAQHALQEDWNELRRRYAETCTALEQTCAVLEQRQKTTQERIEQLQQRQADIKAMQLDPRTEPNREQLRRLRQQLHHAAIELALAEQDDHSRTPRESSLASMTAVELARIGLALFWPIVAGLLLAAALLLGGMMTLFAV